MGKHARGENDPAQKGREFDELNEIYTRKGEDKERARRGELGRVTDSNSGSGDGCAIIGVSLLSGLSLLGYLAARAKGLA